LDLQDFSIQSGDTNTTEDVVPQSEAPEAGLVVFAEEEEGEKLEIKSNMYIERSIQPKNIELAKFLSRPVPIATYTWQLGNSIRETFRPWFLFMNQTSIKKRLDNYHLFQGKLHLKFIINATPFYYGCAMVYYRPNLDIPSSPVTENTLPITASQLPRVCLYPAQNKGATMVLPYIYHKEWLNLNSATDVQNMGQMFIQEVALLRSASAGTRPITITVYAWLEDYQLSGPTFELALQSGTTDEYGDGIVSKPASAIARAAGMLEDVPIIGTFATATRIGASAVSSVAKLFGFTDVPVLDEVHSMKPEPFPHMAATDIGASINKLTLDSKNELSIDSNIVGVDSGDELSIHSLVSREVLLTDFTWTTADAPNDRLFNIRVTPDLKDISEQLTTFTFDPTPLWLVQKMFSFWRGDLEYRFRIICSKYHQGRIRISWSPNGELGSVTNTTTEVFTKIIDISTTTDFTIRVPYMQPTAFLETSDTTTQQWDAVNALTPTPLNANGIITVRVLNELTAPSDAASVDILVFVKGTESLEFMTPKSISFGGTLSPFQVQSGTVYDDPDINEEHEMAIEPIPTNPNINLIYGGECVKSLRTLLRRSVRYRTVHAASSLTGAGLIGTTTIGMNRLPIFPGFDPNGVNTAIGPVAGAARPFNWVSYTPMAFLGQCFLACRGSVIYTVSPLNSALASEMGISRPSELSVVSAANYLGINSQSVASNAAVASGTSIMRPALPGRAMTSNRTMTGVTALVPFYSKFKYRGYDPSTAVLGSASDFSFVDTVFIDTIHTPASSIAPNGQYASGNAYNIYVSAGTDFTFNFFLFVPRIYKYKDNPVA